MARIVILGVALLGVLTACGSGSPQAFHSATKTYSVHEVEVAFSQHGLPLVEAQSQRLPGVTALSNGRGAKRLEIQVAPGGTTLYALVRRASPPHRAREGNVYVFFPAADAGAVHAALAELR